MLDVAIAGIEAIVLLQSSPAIGSPIRPSGEDSPLCYMLAV